MKIIKRNGVPQNFAPNKILSRIKEQAKGLKGVDCDLLFQKVIPMIQDGMSTSDIDQTLAFTAADLVIKHPNYSVLGGRILITRQAKLLGVEINEYDKTYNFFSATTFLEKYSLKDDNKKPIEIPSMMIARVCNHLAKDSSEYDLFYNELKSRLINNATPILTNAGTVRGAMISCNLTMNIGDDTDSILTTINNASWASREGSGIGLLIDNLRSQDSIVSSFKGNASGVVRYADMLQSHMRFFKQGTRSGSSALYLSLWHKDIFRFLELTLPIGDEKLRARDLFTAVVVNDLFMNCLLEEKPWYLFCPSDIEKHGLRPLYELHGEEFEKEYHKAVDLGIGVKVEPKAIWDALIKSQVESGKPYVMYKDNANKRNMQDNIGTIKQSNLCCVDGDTIVNVKDDDGCLINIKMSDLLENFNKGVNYKILSQDLEYRDILTVIKTKEDSEVIKITDIESGNSLICTDDHLIYTKNRGYVKAGELNEDDILEIK